MPRLRRQEARRLPIEAVAQLRAVSANEQFRERARHARRNALLLAPLVVGVWLIERYRMELFNLDEPVRLACSVAFVGLGLAFARDAGQAIGPALARRMDQGTAGTIGFLLRLTLLVVATVVALRMAGLTPRTLAVGGAVTAVVLGLAAQTTIGNLFAGMLLISVRPFRVGERVRLQAGSLAGVVEGTVTQLGLLYVTLTDGDDVILVPNNTVVSAAIVPLREPAKVDLRAHMKPGVKPSQVQRLLERMITIPTRDRPHIHLEEVDDDEVVMRVTATPARDADGPELADEVLAAVQEAAFRSAQDFRTPSGPGASGAPSRP